MRCIHFQDKYITKEEWLTSTKQKKLRTKNFSNYNISRSYFLKTITNNKKYSDMRNVNNRYLGSSCYIHFGVSQFQSFKCKEYSLKIKISRLMNIAIDQTQCQILIFSTSAVAQHLGTYLTRLIKAETVWLYADASSFEICYNFEFQL